MVFRCLGIPTNINVRLGRVFFGNAFQLVGCLSQYLSLRCRGAMNLLEFISSISPEFLQMLHENRVNIALRKGDSGDSTLILNSFEGSKAPRKI